MFVRTLALELVASFLPGPVLDSQEWNTIQSIQLLCFMPPAERKLQGGGTVRTKAHHCAIHTLATVFQSLVSWREASVKAAAAAAEAHTPEKKRASNPFELAKKALRTLGTRTVSDPPAPGSSDEVVPTPAQMKLISIPGNRQDSQLCLQGFFCACPLVLEDKPACLAGGVVMSSVADDSDDNEGKFSCCDLSTASMSHRNQMMTEKHHVQAESMHCVHQLSRLSPESIYSGELPSRRPGPNLATVSLQRKNCQLHAEYPSRDPGGGPGWFGAVELSVQSAECAELKPRFESENDMDAWLQELDPAKALQLRDRIIHLWVADAKKGPKKVYKVMTGMIGLNLSTNLLWSRDPPAICAEQFCWKREPLFPRISE